MELSEILNYVFGTGLIATIVGLLNIRSELMKARAEARRAEAEADTVKITNTEQATRILIDNIVKPLTEKLDETHKELQGNKRELTRLRKAVEAIQLCPYRSECPVLGELQVGEECDERGELFKRQSEPPPHPGRKSKRPDSSPQRRRSPRDASPGEPCPASRRRELHGPSGHGACDGDTEGREPGAGRREPDGGSGQSDGGEHPGWQHDGQKSGPE